jgi:hypothetical protein
VSASFVQTIFKWLGLARYNATRDTFTDGDACEMQCDQYGNLKVAIADDGASTTTWDVLPTVAPIGVDEGLVYSGAGKRVMSAYGLNYGADKIYLMFFDAIAQPSASAVPFLAPLPIEAGAAFSISFPRGSKEFSSAGIYWVASSTANVLTNLSTATLAIEVEYR